MHQLRKLLAVVVIITHVGCGGTVILDETTPVQLSGVRPAPPPPPEPPPAPPPPPRVEVEETRIRVDEKIHFALDRWEIAADSDSLLEEIAQVMNDNPQITRIQIEGHTDNQGAAGYNQTLSERRANSVLERLVENGVERERLVSVGFGLRRPIANNGTDEGRAQNRRVEFNILEQSGGAPAANETEAAAPAANEAEAAAPEAPPARNTRRQAIPLGMNDATGGTP